MAQATVRIDALLGLLLVLRDSGRSRSEMYFSLKTWSWSWLVPSCGTLSPSGEFAAWLPSVRDVAACSAGGS